MAALALSSAAFAQTTEAIPPGWKTCPHCLSNQEIKNEAKFYVPGMPYNPRDISGVWNVLPPESNLMGAQNAFAKDQKNTGVVPPNVPPFTPYGKQLFDATMTGFKAPEGTAVTNSKDPMLKCDPLGWPRWWTYNYGTEFVTLNDRVIEFIEWGHTFRTIWTDGRKLPDNPPENRFLGWSIGHWEPDDTFVIESTGFDDRSWISEAANAASIPGAKGWGTHAWPHSDQMKVAERWKRTSYGTLQSQLTVIDPKVYTKPWTTDVYTFNLLPDTEIWEYFCVPSDSNYFNEKVIQPSNGGTR